MECVILDQEQKGDEPMQIERNIMADLLSWKNSIHRKPLLLKGVRQCGKTWILRHFGKMYFSNVAEFNFDKDKALASFFDGTYDVRRIITQLSTYSNQQILPQETLIIFDEIQTCPQALNALKYFCEDAPEYAVVSAGSLIGITLAANEKTTGFPVGKADIKTLTPCSFDEYLRASDPALHRYIKDIPLEPLPEAFCNKLKAYLLEYLVIGGMPAAETAFLETHDYNQAEQELDSILQSYEADFSKHIPAKDIPKLFMIWQSIPAQFAKENRRFFYGEVRAGARAKDLEDSLQWLSHASMVRKVEAVSVPESPLAAVADRKMFKLYPADVGILRKLAKLSPAVAVDGTDIFSDFKGKLTENLVLEQLVSSGFDPICYWFNDTGKAEVDFLIQDDRGVIPIEVKSGLSLKAKSLKTYRAQFKPHIAVRASMQNLKLDDGLLNVPLYLLGELPRLLSLAEEK